MRTIDRWKSVSCLSTSEPHRPLQLRRNHLLAQLRLVTGSITGSHNGQRYMAKPGRMKVMQRLNCRVHTFMRYDLTDVEKATTSIVGSANGGSRCDGAR